MDIKTSPKKYSKAANASIKIEDISESIELIKKSKADYEFRTTFVPGLVSSEDLDEIGKWLGNIKKFSVQQFRNKNVLDKSWEKIVPYSDDKFKGLAKLAEKYFQKTEIRE